MSFNTLMALLVHSVVDGLGDKPTVMELGNQTLKADDGALQQILERSKAMDLDQVDVEGLRALITQGADARGDRAADYYRLLGFSDYQAIDVNDLYGSLVMDLNTELSAAYDYRETFTLVTNNGTGEHVFNQDAIFRNVHALTAPGGIMIHSMPFYEFVNHGFYSFHPNLYTALAEANDYQLLALGVATRNGKGIVARSEESEAAGPILLDESPVPLNVLLSEAKARQPGLKGLLKRFTGKPESRRFGRLLRGLQGDKQNLLLFSILRKQQDAPFKTPIQGIYAGVVDDVLKPAYGLEAQPGSTK